MLDLRKRLERLSADALSWRIGREQIRKLRFEVNKLLVEPVVLAISNDRRGVLIIQPVVPADFLPQLHDVFLGFDAIHEFRTRYESAKARQRWNALSQRIDIVLGQADPRFTFVKEQLCIINRETV